MHDACARFVKDDQTVVVLHGAVEFGLARHDVFERTAVGDDEQKIVAVNVLFEKFARFERQIPHAHALVFKKQARADVFALARFRSVRRLMGIAENS